MPAGDALSGEQEITGVERCAVHVFEDHRDVGKSDDRIVAIVRDVEIREGGRPVEDTDDILAKRHVGDPVAFAITGGELEGVRPFAALEGVAALAAGERVAAVAAPQDVLPFFAKQPIFPVIAAQVVVSVPTEQPVVAAPAREKVVAGEGREALNGVASANDVVAFPGSADHLYVAQRVGEGARVHHDLAGPVLEIDLHALHGDLIVADFVEELRPGR